MGRRWGKGGGEDDMAHSMNRWLYPNWDGRATLWGSQDHLKSTRDVLKAQETIADKFLSSGMESCLDMEPWGSLAESAAR